MPACPKGGLYVTVTSSGGNCSIMASTTGTKKEKKIKKEDEPKKPGKNEDTSLASWNILED